MTSSTAPVAPDQLAALEARMREAWGMYRDNLVELDGVAYLEAERAEWGHLQEELKAISAARAAVKAALAASAEREAD